MPKKQDQKNLIKRFDLIPVLIFEYENFSANINPNHTGGYGARGGNPCNNSYLIYESNVCNQNFIPSPRSLLDMAEVI